MWLWSLYLYFIVYYTTIQWFMFLLCVDFRVEWNTIFIVLKTFQLEDAILLSKNLAFRSLNIDKELGRVQKYVKLFHYDRHTLCSLWHYFEKKFADTVDAPSRVYFMNWFWMFIGQDYTEQNVWRW